MHVDGLGAIVVVNSERSTGRKKYKSSSKVTSTGAVLDDTLVRIVEGILFILSLIEKRSS